MLRTALVALVLIGLDGPDTTARLRQATTPTALPRVQVQCQLLFAVDVDAAGVVAGVDAVCREPLLTTVFTRSIERWRFDAATANGVPVASRVLVAAVLRPPFLTNMGPCEPPAGACDLPSELPAPTAVVMPAYPPLALGDELVVVEVEVDAEGRVGAARAVGRTTSFDDAALDAARGWHFRPAESDGDLVPSVAYLVFAFEEPVLAPLPY
jgi:TonB family protein